MRNMAVLMLLLVQAYSAHLVINLQLQHTGPGSPPPRDGAGSNFSDE